jgi:hypothetical protein
VITRFSAEAGAPPPTLAPGGRRCAAALNRHAPSTLLAVTQWITAAACSTAATTARAPDAAPGHRPPGRPDLLRKLVAAQWLQRDGTPRKARYSPGALRQVVQRYPLAGLQEDLPWAGLRALLRPAARGGAHGAARLHRTAEQRHRPQRRQQVTVSMRQTAAAGAVAGVRRRLRHLRAHRAGLRQITDPRWPCWS